MKALSVIVQTRRRNDKETRRKNFESWGRHSCLPAAGEACGKSAVEYNLADDDIEIYERRLPHWRLDGSTYFITFRMLEGGLKKQERTLVLEHIKSGDPNFYSLWALTVMPDHVHIVLEPNSNIELSRILKGLKGVSARRINAIRNTKGSIWQDESWDRIIRNEKELIETMNYMYTNPVEKGLIESPDDWKW